MNGVHDMGGMHGLGPIAPETDEPVFHAEWERRVHALVIASPTRGNIDAGRHQRELIPGPDYLRMSYYEKWTVALEALLLDAGLVSERELAQGQPDPNSAKADPPLTAERVAPTLASGGPTLREIGASPRFAVGDQVRARNLHPVGHTRLPRYVRGRSGVVSRYHGAHVLPDAHAHGLGEQPQPLYQVRFEASELWGDAAKGPDAVYIDLWETYLDLA